MSVADGLFVGYVMSVNGRIPVGPGIFAADSLYLQTMDTSEYVDIAHLYMMLQARPFNVCWRCSVPQNFTAVDDVLAVGGTMSVSVSCLWGVVISVGTAVCLNVSCVAVTVSLVCGC